MNDACTLYAAIDLGSNSFHLSLVRDANGEVQTVSRTKRKVRLAAGLDKENRLSEEAMQRGWQCLRLFAEKLQSIPPHHIRIVATATLRYATNADTFLIKASQILGHRIDVISGEEEARLIYLGVNQTTQGPDKRLVLDIGGASSELIAGNQHQAILLFSLPMGCVTWINRYFSDHCLSAENFARAENAALVMLAQIADVLKQQQWQICVGASGTIQAIQAMIRTQHRGADITLPTLQLLKQQVIECITLDQLVIEGLNPEQAPVFAGGLSILIAMFIALDIDRMLLAGGALREGLLHGLLPTP